METFEMDKFLDFIRPEDSELLKEMKAYATEHHVPIVRNEMKQFMETMVMIYKPKRILEIGTAIGFSSIVMAKALEKYYGSLEGVEIISLERSDDMYEQAVSNIKKAGLESVIRVIHGEAEDSLKVLAAGVGADRASNMPESRVPGCAGGMFDMVFMDAAKGQYLTFLPYCMEVLKVDGLLVSDNVLQGGDIAKSRFSVARRQRTIHQRMREYLWELNHREDLQTSIIDIADGVTLSVKLK